MTATQDDKELDVEWLLKLRVVVARCGEMDLARWWNSSRQLAPAGASVLKRGFPRTHHFAQARSVMAIASHRCDQLLSQSDAITLWRLPEAVEDRFESRWDACLDRYSDWLGFFDSVAAIREPDVITAMTGLALITAGEVKAFRGLRAALEGRGLIVGKSFGGTRQDVALLALGYAAGKAGEPVVPFMRASAA
jgi:hypothetical protein